MENQKLTRDEEKEFYEKILSKLSTQKRIVVFVNIIISTIAMLTLFVSLSSNSKSFLPLCALLFIHFFSYESASDKLLSQEIEIRKKLLEILAKENENISKET